MCWTSWLGLAVSILFLFSCSTESSLLSKSTSSDGRAKREPPAVLVPMAFDHEEDIGMKFNKCFYIATNDSIGEKIGVTLHAKPCPSSIVYDFSANTWQPK
ncbi:MAG: hypothetical protein CMD66_02465 [Gammaproteobacteria bacterium]|nr:hypothetical protein [Gammaproteobacteria bacterium]